MYSVHTLYGTSKKYISKKSNFYENFQILHNTRKFSKKTGSRCFHGKNESNDFTSSQAINQNLLNRVVLMYNQILPAWWSSKK